jgi:hypothetical protein
VSPRPRFDGSFLRVLAHSGHTGGGLSVSFKDRLVEFAIEVLAQLRVRASVGSTAGGYHDRGVGHIAQIDLHPTADAHPAHVPRDCLDEAAESG